MRLFRRLAARRMSALPLAVLRIGFSLSLFLEVRALFELRHLYFDPLPFAEQSLAPTAPFLLAWMAATASLLVGYRTRVAAAVCYFFAVAFFGLAAIPAGYECHTDGINILVSLLLLFLPVSRVLSVDSWLARRRGESASSEVGVLSFGLIALVAGTIYFDSALWKLVSPMWLAGLGVWVPASQPFDSLVRVPALLDVKGLVLLASYTTLAFELAFVFLIWIRRLRVPLIAIGLLLHVGIMTILPLPVFGLLMASLLLGLVPGEVYTWPADRARRWRGRAIDRAGTLLATAEPRSPAGPGIPAISSTSTWRERGAAAFLVGWLGLFALCTLQPIEVLAKYGPGGVPGPVPVQGRLAYVGPASRDAASGSANDGTLAFAREAYRRILGVAYVFLGMRSHPVFLDGQFSDYTAETRVVYRGAAADSGASSDRRFYPRVLNRFWLAWTYRHVRPRFTTRHAEARLRRFLAYWSIRLDLDLASGSFVVQQRPIELPTTEWRRGQLARNLASDWRDVAIVDRPARALRFRWLDPRQGWGAPGVGASR